MLLRLGIISALGSLLPVEPVRADNREDLVRAYVERIVVNSLDEPGRQELYFTELQLLNDFSPAFVNAYAEAIKAAKVRADVSLFEHDAMTGTVNRCPIGATEIIDRTRVDTRNMIEVTLQTPDCEGAGAAGPIRLMFVLQPDGTSGTRFVIDDVLRPLENGGWFSLQAWLERSRP
jgi:hypothetical protein